LNIGIVFAYLTYALFSSGDAAIKALGHTPMSTFEISFYAALFSGLSMIFLKPKGERWRDVFKMRHPIVLIVRSFSGLFAGLLGVVSLLTIPFAETYALIFMAPFLVTLMSVVFLRERIGWIGIVAVVLGFVGVVLAVRPGFRELELGHLTAAAAAFFVALSTIIIRRIASSERQTSLLVMPQLVTVVASGLIMTTHYVQPTLTDLGLLLISGAFIAVAQLTLILAARRVSATSIGQAQFSQLIWAIVLGALFFAEQSDVWSLAGVAVIVIAGLLRLRDRTT
jgi:drug/metabolite transporter (DMT)-like permease